MKLRERAIDVAKIAKHIERDHNGNPNKVLPAQEGVLNDILLMQRNNIELSQPLTHNTLKQWINNRKARLSSIDPEGVVFADIATGLLNGYDKIDILESEKQARLKAIEELKEFTNKNQNYSDTSLDYMRKVWN